MELDTECEFLYPAARVWSLIADFGNLSWISRGLTRVDCSGEGVGMIRKLYWNDSKTARIQRLEALDEAAMSMRYSIQNSVLPVSQFEISEHVEPLTAQSCVLRSHIHFQCPSPEYEQDLAAVMAPLIERMCDDLKAYLQANPPPGG